jgi:LysR family transcriptional regulator, glycine cleavage system transcriptional activator
MKNLPPINQLRAFSAAVRYGSVTAAAKAVHLTQAAVSRQITQLEEQLQVSLFLRSSDGLELTEVGAGYYRQVEQALELLEQAGEDLKPIGEITRQRIVISVDGAFGAIWLAPRLGKFLTGHPTIDLEVTVGKSLADNTGKNLVAADVLIVYGQPPWPRYQAEKLIDFIEFPVCSPEYAQQIKSIDDLNNATLIHEADHTGWARWLQDDGAQSIDCHHGPIIYDSISCLTMAVNGAGVAIGDCVTCADWLREGRLVKPFKRELDLLESFYLLTPEVAVDLPAIQTFRRWLQAEILSSGA